MMLRAEENVEAQLAQVLAASVILARAGGVDARHVVRDYEFRFLGLRDHAAHVHNFSRKFA